MNSSSSHIQRARSLRKNMTDKERKLWQYLRNRRFENLKFLRQHPYIYQKTMKGYNYFILDFYCPEKKVAIELDGGIHDAQKEKDSWRDDVLESHGIRTLRIKNDELKDVSSVLSMIRYFIFEK